MDFSDKKLDFKDIVGIYPTKYGELCGKANIIFRPFHLGEVIDTGILGLGELNGPTLQCAQPIKAPNLGWL